MDQDQTGVVSPPVSTPDRTVATTRRSVVHPSFPRSTLWQTVRPHLGSRQTEVDRDLRLGKFISSLLLWISSTEVYTVQPCNFVPKSKSDAVYLATWAGIIINGEWCMVHELTE